MIDTALNLVKMLFEKRKETKRHQQESLSVSYTIKRIEVDRTDGIMWYAALFLTIQSTEDFVIEQIELSDHELAEIRRDEDETVGGMGVVCPKILAPEMLDWSTFLRVNIRPALCFGNRPTEACYFVRASRYSEVPHKLTVTVKTATYPNPFTVTGVLRAI